MCWTQEQEEEEKRKKLREAEEERLRKIKQAEEDKKKAEEEAKLEKERQVNITGESEVGAAQYRRLRRISPVFGISPSLDNTSQ